MMKPILAGLAALIMMVAVLWFRFPHESHIVLSRLISFAPTPREAFTLSGFGITFVLSGTRGSTFGKPVFLADEYEVSPLTMAEVPYLSSVHPALARDHPVAYTVVKMSDDGRAAVAVGTMEGIEGCRVETRYSLERDGVLLGTSVACQGRGPLALWIGDSLSVAEEFFFLPGHGSVFPPSGFTKTLSPSEPRIAVVGEKDVIILTGDEGLKGMYAFVSHGRISTGKQVLLADKPLVIQRRLTLMGKQGFVPRNASDVAIYETFPILRIEGTSRDSFSVGDEESIHLDYVSGGSGVARGKSLPHLVVSPNVRVLKGGSADRGWTVRALEGGLGWAKACRTDDGDTICGNKIVFHINGPGWYAGDFHSHSDNSYSWEGHSVSEMVTGAKRRGLSVLAITDYNAATVSKDCRKEKDFLCFSGIENVTILSGHALVYFTGEAPSFVRGTQQRIDEIRGQGGLFFIAHPFLSRRKWKNWDVSHYNGIEVWNDHCGKARHPENLKAFEKWDELLNKGLRIYGLANSDAHRPGRFGGVRSMVYLRDFSVSGVHESLEHGHVYGTNGPELRFVINGAMMGDTVTVTRGETVKVSVRAWDTSSLLMITLIEKGRAIGRWLGNMGEMTIHPEESTWFRIEVESSGERFAFSNPIWVDVTEGRALRPGGARGPSPSWADEDKKGRKVDPN